MFMNGWMGCVSALVFGKFVAEAVYRTHIGAGASTGAGGGRTCYGPGCFAGTHLTIAAGCLLGVLFTVALFFKSLPLYRRI
jgi:hypothetical protein